MTFNVGSDHEQINYLHNIKIQLPEDANWKKEGGIWLTMKFEGAQMHPVLYKFAIRLCKNFKNLGPGPHQLWRSPKWTVL